MAMKRRTPVGLIALVSISLSLGWLGLGEGLALDLRTSGEATGLPNRSILIELPAAAESCQYDSRNGHQPWRMDAAMSAMAVLRDFARDMGADVTAEIQAGCRVRTTIAANGEEEMALVQKDLPCGAFGFATPLSLIYLHRRAGEVWQARRIIIRNHALR